MGEGHQGARTGQCPAIWKVQGPESQGELRNRLLSPPKPGKEEVGTKMWVPMESSSGGFLHQLLLKRTQPHLLWIGFLRPPAPLPPPEAEFEKNGG